MTDTHTTIVDPIDAQFKSLQEELHSITTNTKGMLDNLKMLHKACRSAQKQCKKNPRVQTKNTLSDELEKFLSVEHGTHLENGWPGTCYGMSKLGIIALTKIMARENEGMLINSVDPGYCKTDQNNNQGTVDPSDGAYTPYLLALLEQDDDDDGEDMSGLHFYEEQEIPWTYQ